MAISARIAAAALGAACAIAGCGKCPDSVVSIDQLVAEHNANAAMVPRLWARAKIAATFADDRGRTFSWGSASPLAAPNGLLLLGKDPKHKLGPYNFVLVGREAANVEVFRVGSNIQEGVYYFWYHFGQHGQAWVGRNDLAGAPGAAGLPINAHQLLAVLSVCPLPDDFTEVPTVAMAMDSDPVRCAYVLTYIDRQPVTRRLGFRRETYFHWGPDVRPSFLAPGTEKLRRRPFVVWFFDDLGRRIMTARLDKYMPVQPSEDAPPDAKPALMPTDIRIDWPQKHSSVHIVLSEMTARAEDKGNPAVASRLERYLPAGLEIERVDANVQPQGGER